jgi:hypothetical protein
MQNNFFFAWFSGRKSYNCPCIIGAVAIIRDLSVKGGTSERCYRTRRGRTDEQRFAIISPYFDGRIKMNGPYPEIKKGEQVRGVILVSLENASFHMVHVYTINWFKKVQNINYCSHVEQPTFNCHKRGGWGVSWHSCLFCHIPMLFLSCHDVTYQ